MCWLLGNTDIVSFYAIFFLLLKRLKAGDWCSHLVMTCRAHPQIKFMFISVVDVCFWVLLASHFGSMAGEQCTPMAGELSILSSFLALGPVQCLRSGCG